MGGDALILTAPAKLNLFLHITGQRADGYHLLQTVYQLLDYGDELEFAAQAGPDVELLCGHSALQGPDNLVLRAARLLQQHTGSRQGARITLHKRLPLGGGLGGGSSNAATTLLALNRLWALNLNLNELAALSLELGADVPVFVHGRSAWAEGIGEKLTPMSLPQRWFAVFTPPCHVATPQIFSHKELTRGTPAIKIPAFPIRGSKNDCEQVASLLYPEIAQALAWLNQHSHARMTGTGASIFADFDSRQEAAAVLQQKPDYLQGFVAQGADRSPSHRALEETA